MTPATPALAPIKGVPDSEDNSRMCQCAGDAAQQIENQEFDVAEGVFDVVAEHPQEQHVADQMENIEWKNM